MTSNPPEPTRSPLRAVELPPPPDYLRDDGRRLWSEVVEAYLLDSHQVEILALAAGALDRQVEARQIVDRDGPCVEDRFGQVRTHPMVAVERDCRLAVARLVRELALEAPPSGARPPRAGGAKW